MLRLKNMVTHNPELAGQYSTRIVSIYTDSFETKNMIADCIEACNETAGEDAQITYTAYVAMLTSSLTTIINGISYMLIAFVAISLVVSCIMIGIITHISVMERTKKIGILRALSRRYSMPIQSSVILIAISIVITILGGLLPRKERPCNLAAVGMIILTCPIIREPLKTVLKRENE